MLEDLKAAGEKLTGLGRPSRVTPRPRQAHVFRFADDAETPNNHHFPLLLYRSPLHLPPEGDPAAHFEVLFENNGWKPAWRDGIYDFNHFHTRTHEVLGIARGRAQVQFGGRDGRLIPIKAGDVVVLPAGTGHCRRSASRDLLVVGAYPEKGAYDEPQPFEVDPLKAREAIAKVAVPAKDPVYGAKGPLRRLWQRPH